MSRHDFLILQLEADLMQNGESVLQALRFQPRVDMFETDTDLLLKMELAGVRTERIEVTLSADDSTLTISGDRAESHSLEYERIRCYQLEIYYGTFERQIVLPIHLQLDREAISANYRDGFLVISIPKKRTKPIKVRSILITTE